MIGALSSLLPGILPVISVISDDLQLDILDSEIGNTIGFKIVMEHFRQFGVIVIIYAVTVGAVDMVMTFVSRIIPQKAAVSFYSFQQILFSQCLQGFIDGSQRYLRVFFTDIVADLLGGRMVT